MKACEIVRWERYKCLLMEGNEILRYNIPKNAAFKEIVLLIVK
jgi:hypothetical protein